MSVDLDIRTFSTSNDFSTIETYCCLVEAVASWNQIDGMWSSFKIGKGWFHETISKVRGSFTSDEVIRLASQCELEQERCILTSIPIRCWRHDGTDIKLGHAMLDIRCWDRDSQLVVEGDSDIEGNAAISVNPANPYWTVVDEEAVEGGKEYNERVAENLDALGELLIVIAKVLRPRSAKLFVDEGWNLPCNSHCTYFDSAEAVIADLNLIARVWKDGLPKYGGMPPLRDYDEAKHELAFSSLRSIEQRRSLWEALSQRLPALSKVTPQIVEDALEVTILDIHRVNDGFFLFDYPYFLNSFVAPFYLDVLDCASQKAGNDN